MSEYERKEHRIFSAEGPVFGFLDKVGQIILLSIVWMLGCLPVVTAVTSTTALYYATIKSIRRDYGSALQEFWSSYKANLKRGIPITVILGALLWLLGSNLQLLLKQGDSGTLFWGSAAVLAVLLALVLWISPVLSRFSMGAWSACRLAFVMGLRFWYFTLVLALGTAALVLLQIYLLPMATVVLLPGLWCLIATFMVEIGLRKFMPPKEENDDSWYYQ